jgi:hypothetical protein
MLIVKKVKKNDDGTYSSSWSLTEDQVSFLLTYAINHLIQQGLLEVDEKNEPAQLELAFLKDVPTELLGRA